MQRSGMVDVGGVGGRESYIGVADVQVVVVARGTHVGRRARRINETGKEERPHGGTGRPVSEHASLDFKQHAPLVELAVQLCGEGATLDEKPQAEEARLDGIFSPRGRAQRIQHFDELMRGMRARVGQHCTRLYCSIASHADKKSAQHVSGPMLGTHRTHTHCRHAFH